jgi:hypothetical protein
MSAGMATSAGISKPSRIAAAIALAIGIGGFQGCGVDSSVEVAPQTVDGIRVESLRILPLGSRFVLANKPTSIVFRKYHAGYFCSEILMNLTSAPIGTPPAFQPDTRIRLPGTLDCAVDSAGHDSTIQHVFGTEMDSVRLANSAGVTTDSAKVVVGAFVLDSIAGKFSPLTKTFSVGGLTVVDSSLGIPRVLFAESLTTCQYFNSANYKPQPTDTSVQIKFTVVNLDPSTVPDKCNGTHADTIALQLAVP